MISIKTVLKKKKLLTGKYPIFLRITMNRKSIYFRTPYTSFEKEWDANQGMFNVKATDHLHKNRLLLKFMDRATSVVTELEQEKGYYTLEEVEGALRLTTNPNTKMFYPFWDEIIAEQKLAGRTGNARIHSEVQTSVKRFHGGKELTFLKITPEFLEKYEAWLRSRGGTGGGIGVKMRCIRALFNTAIRRGLIKNNLYPFRVYKVSRLKSSGVKKALSLDDIQKIANIDLSEYPTLIDYRNYFVFSFYTRGMNFADMMLLEWNDITDDRIYYIRSKTKSKFQIKILPPAQKIIEYYKAQNRGTKYVFPILLQDKMTFSHLENRKRKMLKRYNRRLKEIGELCQISKPMSSYVARQQLLPELFLMHVHHLHGGK